MMFDYQSLYEEMAVTQLKPWVDELKAEVDVWLTERRHGDLARWSAAVEDLQQFPPTKNIDLKTAVTAGNGEQLTDEQRDNLKQNLLRLSPWRKGPFHIHAVHVDTEWRSDWKWDRVVEHISPLKNRVILDIGCGSGYHCWRMAGAGAKLTIGVDPSQLFMAQYWAIRHFVGQQATYVLPLRLEHLPESMSRFDTVFSMGVLYHRKSPIDHMFDIKRLLRDGGEMVLETLVVEDGFNDLFVPEDRYAKMRNVWFIPSPSMLKLWAERCGFVNARIVDVCDTTVDEQRKTEWMQFESLPDFLDPDDHSKTIEGYPAPKRAVLVAEKPRK